MAKPKVLFVDDEEEVGRGIRNSLRRQPFDIVTATSGAEALELLEQQSIDVVVSDERMPGMPGSELLSRVCKRYPQTVRILLTGQASVGAAIKAVNEGNIYRFLTKPIPKEELVAAIVSGLEAKQRKAKEVGANRERHSDTEPGEDVLQALEAEHPGIGHVSRSPSGGVYLREAE